MRERLQLKLVEGILKTAHIELRVSKPHTLDATQSIESFALVSCGGRPIENVITIAFTVVVLVGIVVIVVVDITVVVVVVAPDGVNALVVFAATVKFEVSRTPCFRKCA